MGSSRSVMMRIGPMRYPSSPPVWRSLLNKVQSRLAPLAAAAALAAVVPAPAGADEPARELFGRAQAPAALPAQAIGGHARGCLAGAAELAPDGPFHQVMRLSRRRNFGHPELVAYLERLAEAAHAAAGWPGLLVGDLAQPRGGPMLTGHASHQSGLDADIWLMPAPARRYSAEERETVSAVSAIGAAAEVPAGNWRVDPAVWTAGHAAVLRAAAGDPRVARIFVHPAIKRALCETAGEGPRGWLGRIRPWYGHHYHFHVRLACPVGDADCRDQAPPPAGDGCGAELDWWFTEEPYRPPETPPKPKPPLRLADLPAACRQVLQAP